MAPGVRVARHRHKQILPVVYRVNLQVLILLAILAPLRCVAFLSLPAVQLINYSLLFYCKFWRVVLVVDQTATLSTTGASTLALDGKW